jgi:hypothetical protein
MPHNYILPNLVARQSVLYMYCQKKIPFMFNAITLAAGNPFLQLMEMIHSPLFWLMVIMFVGLLWFMYYYYVRSSNAFSVEERYLSADLEHFGYYLVDARADAEALFPPDSGIPENISITRSVCWRIKATRQDSPNDKVQLLAKIFYRNHQIVTVTWLPNIKNPGLVF